MAYQKRSNVPSDDYCAYVTSMERKTSMCEGPHFPNLGSMFKNKKPPQNQKAAGVASQGKGSTSAGLFGRAEHVGYEISERSSQEEQVKNYGGTVKSV